VGQNVPYNSLDPKKKVEQLTFAEIHELHAKRMVILGTGVCT